MEEDQAARSGDPWSGDKIMIERKLPTEIEARRFWTAFADAAEDTPPQELLEELREAGEDPAELAERVRVILLNAIKQWSQAPLREAQARHAEALRKLAERTFSLPADMLKKRAILAEVFARRPELLTALFRDLDRVPDKDVDGMLSQLAALGLLDFLDKD